MMTPCRHLDYTEGAHEGSIEQCARPLAEVRFWLLEKDHKLARVQYCKKNGCIKAIFTCYKGPIRPLLCWEP